MELHGKDQMLIRVGAVRWFRVEGTRRTRNIIRTAEELLARYRPRRAVKQSPGPGAITAALQEKPPAATCMPARTAMSIRTPATAGKSMTMGIGTASTKLLRIGIARTRATLTP